MYVHGFERVHIPVHEYLPHTEITREVTEDQVQPWLAAEDTLWPLTGKVVPREACPGRRLSQLRESGAATEPK